MSMKPLTIAVILLVLWVISPKVFSALEELILSIIRLATVIVNNVQIIVNNIPIPIQ